MKIITAIGASIFCYFCAIGVSFAQQQCSLVVIDLGREGVCSAPGVYAGPWSQKKHGGSCLIANGCEIKARQTRNTKDCGNGTYVGPEEVRDHGGYCVEVTGSSFEFVAKESYSKNCSDGYQYVGAGRPDMHSGHCVRIMREAN